VSALYLRNARFVDWRTNAIVCTDLKVEMGPGGTTTPVDEFPAGAEAIDCAGMIVTRAFANGHHHIYSALARGMPPPQRSPESFKDILELIWWNLDKKLDMEMIRASAMVTGIEAARCGCTFIVDHHASPGAPAGSLHVIAEALDEVGVSHLLCYELSDRDGAEALEAGFEETDAYLKGRQGLVGVHASFTVCDATLERAVALARGYGTGIHIHVAEAESDEEDCRARFGRSVAQRLADAGALELPRTILAHCLHLDDVEREIVAGSAAWVVHNTQSNANNAVGRFDPRGLGERIFIGTDGMHSDMLSATGAMYLEGQSMGGCGGCGGLTPADACRRLRRVHEYLEMNGIAGDGENNLVILDYPSPTPVTQDNWAAHVVYGMTGAHVHSVISQGALIVRDRHLTTVDEERVFAHEHEQAMRLWKLL